jgi:chemotaxis protein MotB
MMSNKKVHHEDHPDETWLIPYADMLTLLLALFIVMFAMSQVDKEKLKKTSEQFNIIFAGGSGTLEQEGNSIIPMENIGALENTSGIIEEGKMNEVKRMLEKEIENKGYSDKVKVQLNNEGLEISIQDAVLFNSGEAEVLKETSPLLIQISSMLKSLDNDIKIVGHTDNVPIRTAKFRSNWDLSSMRAVNVMNFMAGAGGISPNKFSVQAYGEFKPKYTNSTENGRAKNRRVEILIIRNYPVSTPKAN